jgi:Asp/Glu/hydantoin racemase
MLRLGLLHAAVASIAPVNQAIAKHHPEWIPLNLLDDGLQRHFHTGNDAGVADRLGDLARIACDEYGCQALLATCSAARLEIVEGIGYGRGVPCIKIDYPMCEAAVGTGGRIGVIVSFPPTKAVTIATLEEAAKRQKLPLDYQISVVPEALKLLNSGDRAAHDEIMTREAERMVKSGADSVLLAQVSMAHLGVPLARHFGVPVFESLSTSLVALSGAALPAAS